MKTLWRLTISPSAEVGVDPRAFCLEHGLLGVGWPTGVGSGAEWKEYYNAGHVRYRLKGDKGWWPALNALRNRMSVNDLCWTRDRRGEYYLGRITGGWEYRADAEHRRADVTNVRRCDWHKVGAVDGVPGKVVNSFRVSRTLQAVDHRGARNYSQMLFNMMSGSELYPIAEVGPNILDLLLPEDLEDLVGIYLQNAGYRIVPSSCKRSTVAYEFVLIHHRTGERAVVQVKSGRVPIDADVLDGVADRVFLFAASGRYPGNLPEGTVCLKAEDLEDFLRRQPEVFPLRIRMWLKRLSLWGLSETGTTHN